jgi:hypothetical protein
MAFEGGAVVPTPSQSPERSEPHVGWPLVSREVETEALTVGNDCAGHHTRLVESIGPSWRQSRARSDTNDAGWIASVYVHPAYAAPAVLITHADEDADAVLDDQGSRLKS